MFGYLENISSRSYGLGPGYVKYLVVCAVFAQGPSGIADADGSKFPGFVRDCIIDIKNSDFCLV